MKKISRALARVREASAALGMVEHRRIDVFLRDLSRALLASERAIIAANRRDLARMPKKDPRYARLELTGKKLRSIAADLKRVASLPSPLNRPLEQRRLKNGLRLEKITVPLGVVGVIYEARPNVTIDVASLCLKSGNACVLKGGSDAVHSNRSLLAVIQKTLKKHRLPAASVLLLPPDRATVDALLRAEGMVDVIIPRGGASLIEYVRTNAKVPVIETGAGIVHVYIDRSADRATAARVVHNAKTNRPSACNALDTLLVHRSRLRDLPNTLAPLAKDRVTLYADQKSAAALRGRYPASLLKRATAKHFGTEFLSLTMSIKTVDSLDEALAHIARFGSKHTEAIVTEDARTRERFLREVDAAVVMSNASTAFTDGGQFGMGAEIGVSTQKLHARGPMALPELTSYKWILRGHGQVRGA
jgi:glutamate-5-semialdehyde dehydrogenase